MGYDYSNIGGTYLEKKEGEKTDDGWEIELVTIDRIIGEKNERIDFIKIDVEGMEEDVLMGAVNTIDRDRPIVMIESFDKYSKICDFFSRWNYGSVALGSSDYLFYNKEVLGV